jgi:hypothetical protein
MLELNQELRNLRDPQNTRVATLSIADGEIGVQPGDRWVITGVSDEDYIGLKISGYDDDDATEVTVLGLPGGFDSAQIHIVQGGQVPSSPLDTCTTAPCVLDLGGSDIAQNVFRIQVIENSFVIGESWLINVGRITYHQTGSSDTNYNHLEMGASLIQQRDSVYMRQSPTFKEPVLSATPPDVDFFVRVMQLMGSESQSGRGEFSVLVNLVDNYGVSRHRPLMDPAYAVRFQIHGELEESFCNALLERDPSFYAYDGTGTGCESGDVDVLYDPNETFTYELSHAVVNVFVRKA